MINNIMTNLTKLRIHVCPIGYEVDRIVKSAIELRADRVWIIKEKITSKEKAKKFIKLVEIRLKNQNIEIKEKGVSRDDLFDNLRVMKEIFQEEKNNEIHVNVSAGSKIQAIACMMACMMFKEYNPKPYYVEPKSYETPLDKPQSSGVKRIIPLPNYEIKKPDDKLVQALEIIHNNDGKISKKKMAELIIKSGLIDVDDVNKKIDQGDYAKLDHHFIKPLKNIWHFITVEKIGRMHFIEITSIGKEAYIFLVPS